MAEMVPSLRGLVIVGSLGTLGGFAAGFSVAERIYASDAQKSSVRTVATIAATAVAITAVVTSLSVLRARSS